VLARCSEEQLAAISDFTFNLGGGRPRASTLRRRIDDRQMNDVAGELRKWVLAGGKKLPGLVARRELEIKLFFS